MRRDSNAKILNGLSSIISALFRVIDSWGPSRKDLWVSSVENCWNRLFIEADLKEMRKLSEGTFWIFERCSFFLEGSQNPHPHLLLQNLNKEDFVSLLTFKTSVLNNKWKTRTFSRSTFGFDSRDRKFLLNLIKAFYLNSKRAKKKLRIKFQDCWQKV